GVAVAGLGRVETEPGFLHLREHAVAGEPLDRGDLLADRRAHRRRAGAHCDAVEVDRAGAALRDAAAVFRAGEADVLPQRPEEGRIGLHLYIAGLAIDREGWHFLPPKLWLRLPPETACRVKSNNRQATLFSRPFPMVPFLVSAPAPAAAATVTRTGCRES